MTACCKDCIFYSPTQYFNDGQCRNKPPGGPYPYKDGSGTVMVDIWPHTEERDWCGSFMARGGEVKTFRYMQQLGETK